MFPFCLLNYWSLFVWIIKNKILFSSIPIKFCIFSQSYKEKKNNRKYRLTGSGRNGKISESSDIFLQRDQQLLSLLVMKQLKNIGVFLSRN
jgi:hypothetical protein